MSLPLLPYVSTRREGRQGGGRLGRSPEGGTQPHYQYSGFASPVSFAAVMRGIARRTPVLQSQQRP